MAPLSEAVIVNHCMCGPVQTGDKGKALAGPGSENLTIPTPSSESRKHRDRECARKKSNDLEIKKT